MYDLVEQTLARDLKDLFKLDAMVFCSGTQKLECKLYFDVKNIELQQKQNGDYLYKLSGNLMLRTDAGCGNHNRGLLLERAVASKGTEFSNAFEFKREVDVIIDGSSELSVMEFSYFRSVTESNGKYEIKEIGDIAVVENY